MCVAFQPRGQGPPPLFLILRRAVEIVKRADVTTAPIRYLDLTGSEEFTPTRG